MPVALSDYGVAYDSVRNLAWVFGGRDASSTLNSNTWQRASAGSGVVYGSGCGAPPVALSQVLLAQPRIGATACARVGNVPSSFAFMAAGFSDQAYGPFPLPLPLNGLGMPGCFLLHSADVFGLPLLYLSPTTAEYSLSIPNSQPLVGMHVYLQVFSVALGANPRDVVASNALDWYIGG
jgi:hypothetical protein